MGDDGRGPVRVRSARIVATLPESDRDVFDRDVPAEVRETVRIDVPRIRGGIAFVERSGGPPPSRGGDNHERPRSDRTAISQDREPSLMHIVTLTYTADLAQLDEALADHRDWLDLNYADGGFLASGPLEPRTGGVILTANIGREDLDARLANDPFGQRGLADYAVATVTLSRTALSLEQFARWSPPSAITRKLTESRGG